MNQVPNIDITPTALSYCQGRVQELGISDEQDTITVEYTCYDDFNPRPTLVFSENERDGIDILYVWLNGLKTYLKNENSCPTCIPVCIVFLPHGQLAPNELKN